jgi:hypothetical protein
VLDSDHTRRTTNSNRLEGRLSAFAIGLGAALLIASVLAPIFADGITVPFQFVTLFSGGGLFIGGCVTLLLR